MAGLTVKAVDLTGGGSIHVEFETEAVMNCGGRGGEVEGASDVERVVVEGGIVSTGRRQARVLLKFDEACWPR